MNKKSNPTQLMGISFVEFVSPQPDKLHSLFLEFGFSRVMTHQHLPIDVYKQGNIVFLLNRTSESSAGRFGKLHGPSIASMGWKFKNPEVALKSVDSAAQHSLLAIGDYRMDHRLVTCIKGIGDSLIYFLPADLEPETLYQKMGFVPLQSPDMVPEKGFVEIDHLTNNVAQGDMQKWADFYKNLFGFTEVRYFDIRGEKTGLLSYALRSPCGTFAIPINEGTEEKSQINEYLVEYNGPGIQHLAFLTYDILDSLQKLKGTSITTLDMDDEYYEDVFKKFPNISEDKKDIRKAQVLVDGDEDGYLLQIFTKNIIGPIFIEIIQRKNHSSFGEGNFSALFRSLERDQAKRGIL